MTQVFLTQNDVMNWVDQTCANAIQPGLERVEWLLTRLDHPERRCRFIHIAGTNGKGSTGAMISSVLQEAGYTVGSFISPHVVCWNERIQVNGEYISEESFVQWANRLQSLIEEMKEGPMGTPSVFEFYTVLALCYFAYEVCPWFVVWETGLGGRLDATNVVHPLVSVITRIGIDHTGWLGNTFSDIAFEKAGIIKRGVPVICSSQITEVEKLIVKKSQEENSPCYVGGRHFEIQSLDGSVYNHQAFRFSSVFRALDPLSIPFIGEHQLQNAATALMTLEILRQRYAAIIEDHHFRQGLEKVAWPGRIEQVCEHPLVILDGAHNEDGMNVLVNVLKKWFSDKKIIVMIAMMKDKDAAKIIAPLMPLVDKVIITEIPRESRSYSAKELAHIVEQQMDSREAVFESPIVEGIQQMKMWSSEDTLILITGSLYLISEVRPHFVKDDGTTYPAKVDRYILE